jgi:hypothetical protein
MERLFEEDVGVIRVDKITLGVLPVKLHVIGRRSTPNIINKKGNSGRTADLFRNKLLEVMRANTIVCVSC